MTTLRLSVGTMRANLVCKQSLISNAPTKLSPYSKICPDSRRIEADSETSIREPDITSSGESPSFTVYSRMEHSAIFVDFHYVVLQ